ncbi:MAG: NUDIX hydrolase [Myxococcaceae bacterium]|nr:NUDIX hydrolase [Myxococcaceae bacterium]
MTAPSEWKLLRTRAERDFRVFTARTLDVADPRDGTEYVRTVLDCPDWVNVVALTRDQRLVLVRQFRFGTWANSLEIPGGVVDPHETDVQAAALRELEEETGYVPDTLERLGVCHPNPALQANRLHSFLARGCRQVHGGRPDGSEDLEVVLVRREDVPGLVTSGQLSHALVLAALLYDALGPRALTAP